MSSETICKYCKKDFNTISKLNNHKNRQTGCISWFDMDQLINKTNNDEILQLNKKINSQPCNNFEILRLNKIINDIQNHNNTLKQNLEINNKNNNSDITKFVNKLIQERNKYNDLLKDKNNIYKEYDEQKQLIVNLLEHKDLCYWDEVHIIAPQISKKTKEKLKTKIYKIKTIHNIKEYIEFKYQNYQVLDIHIESNKKIIIEIVNNDDICNICFIKQKQKISICKICKNSEICFDCENKQKNIFKKCAFCNTNY